jgi:hypothetical protein
MKRLARFLILFVLLTTLVSPASPAQAGPQPDISAPPVTPLDAPTTPLLYEWSDNFDGYAAGSQMHGQGGWKGWFNDPAAGALVTNTLSHTSPNVVAIAGASDLVHEYSGYTSGGWQYTAWQYIPNGAAGKTYFLLLNTYNDSGSGLNWSLQVGFDMNANTVTHEGAAGNTLPLVKGQWVKLRAEIDLNADRLLFYYNNQLLVSTTWTGGVSSNGARNIGAVDLFGNGASTVYYDDLSLFPVGVDWYDNLDSYATGSQAHGQGGWKGWLNNPAVSALITGTVTRSTPNALQITGASDLVHEYNGYTTGAWRYTAWQYIPSASTGLQFFIMLNTYNDSGSGLNWSLQLRYDLNAGTVTNIGASGATLPLLKDQWVKLRVEINLDTDWMYVYYGDNLLLSSSWTGGVSGNGALNIAAADFYSEGAGPVYYDDLSLVHANYIFLPLTLRNH